MSLAHIKFFKQRHDETAVVYIVRSPDFNQARAWQDVAEIAIDLKLKSYSFKTLNDWAGQKVVPPYVYGLDSQSLERLLSTEFMSYGYGAWTGRIMSHVTQMLSAEVYPDETP
jgi:hypothetical protein